MNYRTERKKVYQSYIENAAISSFFIAQRAVKARMIENYINKVIVGEFDSNIIVFGYFIDFIDFFSKI